MKIVVTIMVFFLLADHVVDAMNQSFDREESLKKLCFFGHNELIQCIKNGKKPTNKYQLEDGHLKRYILYVGNIEADNNVITKAIAEYLKWNYSSIPAKNLCGDNPASTAKKIRECFEQLYNQTNNTVIVCNNVEDIFPKNKDIDNEIVDVLQYMKNTVNIKNNLLICTVRNLEVIHPDVKKIFSLNMRWQAPWINPEYSLFGDQRDLIFKLNLYPDLYFD